ncbi:MAG: NAD(P)H-binding protein [Bacteroidales bacterium]|nr:NAD(P)H-binding protein [Bacteroidales bacterium]
MIINAIIFGATGMVGRAVMLEALDSADVENVLVINRRKIDYAHPKLHEIVHDDFFDFSALKEQLKEYNACYFCLGVSSMGMKEEDYHRLTYDLTMAAATTLAEANPNMCFVYVSGTGTDSSEKGKMMWARVKGKTENHFLKLPFRSVFMFRPGYIQPLRGIKSRVNLYNKLYEVFGFAYPLLKKLWPATFISSVELGKAMLGVSRIGYSKSILESGDIARAGRNVNT